MQQILTSPCQQGGGGGVAAPADSGADASVRLAGRTSSTQLDSGLQFKNLIEIDINRIVSLKGKAERTCWIRKKYFILVFAESCFILQMGTTIYPGQCRSVFSASGIMDAFS